MSFHDGDYVKFYDRDHRRYPEVICGYVCVGYQPPRSLEGADGDILVRLDPGHGGWAGGDGNYYWWISELKLFLVKRAQRCLRPVSPIFYEVRL